MRIVITVLTVLASVLGAYTMVEGAWFGAPVMVVAALVPFLTWGGRSAA